MTYLLGGSSYEGINTAAGTSCPPLATVTTNETNHESLVHASNYPEWIQLYTAVAKHIHCNGVG